MLYKLTTQMDHLPAKLIRLQDLQDLRQQLQ